MASSLRDIMYTFFEEIINNGRLELIDDLMTEDFTNTRTALDSAATLAAGAANAPLRREGSSGRDGFRKGLTMIRTAFPDYRNDIEELVIEGDRVAGSWLATGTHQGEFLGIAATGRKLHMAEAGIMTFRDGRMATFWGIGDELGVLDGFGTITFDPKGATNIGP
ncbi:ester cyclase [Dactylosporangium sp. CA-092794]|uniref:ester cyclase n=1 Tax=Dactylosporangium sp. CA-092794 TaxID=3239929 RepID=UPI003D91992B